MRKLKHFLFNPTSHEKLHADRSEPLKKQDRIEAKVIKLFKDHRQSTYTCTAYNKSYKNIVRTQYIREQINLCRLRLGFYV